MQGCPAFIGFFFGLGGVNKATMLTLVLCMVLGRYSTPWTTPLLQQRLIDKHNI